MLQPSTDRMCRLGLGLLVWGLVSSYALPTRAEDMAKQPTEPERAPVCDTPIKLGATIYNHDQPDRSIAMLRTPKTQVAGIYRRGMFVEGFQVVVVEPRGVLLERDDAYCWLRLQPDPSRPAAQPPPPPPARPKPKKKKR